MRRTPALGCFLLLLSLGVTPPVAAQTGCAKLRSERSLAGGEKAPTLAVQCDPAGEPRLLEADAARAVCDAASLPASHAAACERAAAAAHAVHRATVIGAALRQGASEAELVERYEASGDEIEAAESSPLLAAPAE